jgi:hypothetical protein
VRLQILALLQDWLLYRAFCAVHLWQNVGWLLWKAFGNDPQWKEMSGNPIYKNNVSHIDVTLWGQHPIQNCEVS